MILYICPLVEQSGYGQASRGNIEALKAVGYEVTGFDYLAGKPLDIELIEKSKIVIYHLPVETLPFVKIPCKPCFVYTTFETNLFPAHWITILNAYNDIKGVLVPSTYNKEALERSGYKGKVYVIPHPVDFEEINRIDDSIIKKRLPESIVKDKPYIFYSIFQWSERKNPVGLLKAYLTEFNPDEKVLLILKTYLTGNNDYELIMKEIINIKENLNLKIYPEILLIVSRLEREEIISLHKFCDCYVSPHRAEGAGIPIMEAISCKSRVIATKYSGNLEFCDDENTVFINCIETVVYGQNIFEDWKKQYNGKQIWAEPNLIELKQLMRDSIGHTVKEFWGFKEFTFEKIGEKFKEAMND